MITQFRTIADRSEGLYKEKGSKFIGIAVPTINLEAVDLELEGIRKAYHDARHHCYAYIIGTEQKEFRANDDGEPNHSAGDPILGQIKANGLTNVLIVVVRYFGGTKLGVSGLINAYRSAATDALAHGKIITIDITRRITLNYDYSATNEVMRIADNFNLAVVNQEFNIKCRLRANVIVSRVDELVQKVKLLKDTGVDVDMVID